MYCVYVYLLLVSFIYRYIFGVLHTFSVCANIPDSDTGREASLCFARQSSVTTSDGLCVKLSEPINALKVFPAVVSWNEHMSLCQ